MFRSTQRIALMVRAVLVATGCALVLMLGACGGSRSDASAFPDRAVETTSIDAIASDDETAAPSTTATTLVPTTTTTTPTTTTTAPQPLVPDAFFFWLPSGLPDDFAERTIALDQMERVAVVKSGTMHVKASVDAAGEIIASAPDGFVYPVEAVVVDPAEYTAFIDPAAAEILATLEAGQVILGETAAALRQVSVGDSIRFEDGRELAVVAIVGDGVLGSTELMAVDPTLFVTRGTVRGVGYFDYDGDIDQLETELRTIVDTDASFRLGQRGQQAEVRTSRPDDSEQAGLPPGRVRSQLAIKQIFGEFAYKPGSGGTFQIEQAWIDENLVTAELPLLGRATCHRIVIDLVTEVMNKIIADGREELIDRRAFQGCWNPRFIFGSSRPSHHSWGIAVDVNFFNPLDGDLPGSPINNELLKYMADAGFTSGHLFTNADPGHFEYYGTP